MKEKYNSEFKSMSIELYKIGTSVKELRREYGISKVSIYNPILYPASVAIYYW